MKNIFGSVDGKAVGSNLLTAGILAGGYWVGKGLKRVGTYTWNKGVEMNEARKAKKAANTSD
jgi:hypothetical protein